MKPVLHHIVRYQRDDAKLPFFNCRKGWTEELHRYARRPGARPSPYRVTR